MKPTEIKLDEHTQRLLDKARNVPPPDPDMVAQERAMFLEQADYYRATVSETQSRRHNGWINNLITVFQSKERNPMLNTLMAILITITLFLGGAASTIYAAQASLPDEAMYPLKTWSENVRLSMAGSPQAKLELTLKFTNHRIAEIAGLLATDRPVTEGVASRLQQQLDAALQIAAGMNDPQMIQVLERIRTQAKLQSGAVAALMGSEPVQEDPLLMRILMRLQAQEQLAAAGETDPQGFRLQVQVRARQYGPSQTPNPTRPGYASQTPGVTPDPTSNSYGPGPGGSLVTGTPGQYGPGVPNPSQTPMPTGGSYGPGPGAGQQTPTSAGYGPGSNPSRTPQAASPGFGQPTATHGSGGSGSGGGVGTPEQGGNPGGLQPTDVPGQGSSRP
jgi:hypothetical protein